MMEFDLYRGPGNRLVALGVTPSRNAWTVQSGLQGSRMRVSTYPISEYASLQELAAAVVTERYVLECRGKISPHGEILASTDSSSLFWNASGVPSDRFASFITTLSVKCMKSGIGMTFVNDASGTYLRDGTCRFGMTSAKQVPGCVSQSTGAGSGTVPLDTCPLIAAFAVIASRRFTDTSSDARFELTLGDAHEQIDGDGVLERVAKQLTAVQLELLRDLRVHSLALAVRGNTEARVRF